MNIMFINSIGKNSYGGGEKWMVKSASGLLKRGHRVILASREDSMILKAAQQHGVETAVFTIHGDFSPVTTARIKTFLAQENIDVLICNLNKDVRVAGLAARLLKSPLVIARHGMLLCGKSWRHKLTLTKLVDGIITNTESIKAVYATYGWFAPDFVKVIYNGIEDKSHVPAYDFAKDFPGKKVIFSAGRLAEQKGFPYLIEAAAILKKERDDLVFAVSGKGKLEQELKALVKKNGLEASFHFLGFSENVDPYMKGCTLFVLASIFEGMPNVVMEAMALGKAVVATDVNGTGELMEHQKTGLIVPPRNPAALADAIRTIIDDEAMLRKFEENGLARVQTHFSIEKTVENIEQYLMEKLAEKKRRA
ncbi:glycosyl transferase group 1 [Chloroherpeton thalassium ATCC 35110]|uniref:Glycosyl transferase group 1 n=1 Tax=Chloroherpeton thalassium (strain ATCC 35110 / GB-78) TaxID=517418 RepID=B3QXL2_CHLT3|nr:glycosyltransferase [Chloroherpeton thalassium]ACF14927.1 glycosyl transferase group 1 [Chloroherpeton thalassium ATCC 35110]